jgi:hypothetical protein
MTDDPPVSMVRVGVPVSTKARDNQGETAVNQDNRLSAAGRASFSEREFCYQAPDLHSQTK